MFADLSKIYGRFLIICAFIGACFLCFSATAEKAYARTGADSLIAFENNTNLSFGSVVDIVKSIIKIIKLTIACLKELFEFRFSEVSNTCIPYEIGPEIPSHCPQHKSFEFTLGTIWALIATLVLLPITFFIPIVGQLLAVVALVMYYPIFVACIGVYSLSPAEYVMMGGSADGSVSKELQCIETNGHIMIDPKKQDPYLTVQDVPFIYNCTEPSPDGPEIEKKAYVGSDSEFCATERSRALAMPKMTHKTFIMFVNIWDRMAGNRSKCAKDHLVIGDPDKSPQSIDFNIGFPIKAKLYTYYTLMGNRIRLCSAVGNDVLMPNPVLLGCVHIPPPVEKIEIEQYLKDIIQGTRCQYIMPGSHRRDLSRVADIVIMGDAKTRDYNSVYLFLKSDWHILSTVVGCFQDILEKIFLDITYGQQNQPFLKLIQNGLKNMVFVCLILYLSLTGIRVMSSPQPPSRGEWVMFAIKFAVVLYVATGDIWFTSSTKGTSKNEAIGLYPAIMDTMQLVGTIFMDAREMNDPVKMCYYKYGSDKGRNLLGQNTIDLGGGYKAQLSVWDYIDCILVTYLNFNSCNFTTAGMILMWLITTSIFFGGSGILLCMLCLIYLYVLLEVVFEYAHIMILSMFVVTILVMISPIIMCFYLFDITKEITESWFHMLLGYMIYPGALFAFLALMLATFDSVFYGANLNHDKINQLYDCSLENNCPEITEATLEELCGANYKDQSLYCAMLSSAIGKRSITNCGTRGGTFVTFFTESRDIPLLGEFTMAKRFTIVLFMKHIVSLMLFALLFHFMMGSIVEFIAQLFGVPSLSGYAAGGKIGSMLAQKVAGAGLSAMGLNVKAAKGALSGLKALKNKIGGGKKGGGDKGGGGDAKRDTPQTGGSGGGDSATSSSGKDGTKVSGG